MKYTFTLPHYPNSTFELETSMWTGKSKLWKDGELFERSSDKGKPFIIISESGEVHRIYPKPDLPDLIPTLEINGVKHRIVQRLPWYQYVLALSPILMLFIGGALGAIAGLLASLYNLQIFRTEGSDILKYLKVIGITIFAYFSFLIISQLFVYLIN